MNSVADIVNQGAAAVARALERREISCVEVTQACLDTIAKRDQSINAMMHVDTAGALKLAKSLDNDRGGFRGPLYGVPVVLKDNIDVAGMPATAGIRAYAGRVPDDDAPVAADLRTAGAIILGKATLHEGALGATNDNPFSGKTHHPLRHGYTPGGSSGGSAAAVLAGYTPLAIGSDTLGSVRVPSAYCGLCGLKPTNGNVSIAGMTPLAAHLDTAGPMGRTVADLILAMRAMDRTTDATTPTQPARNWYAPIRKDLRDVSIAVITSFEGFDIEDEVAAHYFRSIGVAADLGARLVKFDLHKLDLGKIRRAGFIEAQSGAVKYHGAQMKQNPDGFSGVFHRAAEYVAKLDSGRLAAAAATIKQASNLVDQTFDTAHLIALPTTPQTAFSFDQRVPDNQADLTALANLHGCPAVSVPMGVTGSTSEIELPTGIQLMAPRFDDARLLQCAGALESAL